MASFDLKNLPKSVIVFLVLFLGVTALFFMRKPHDLCDTEVDALRENQKGLIFPGKIEKSDALRPPLYEKALANCKMGTGSEGACFEYFKILRRLTVDLDGFSPKCGEALSEVVEVKRGLGEGIKIMAEIAWGETAPEKDKITGWLESPDLALYCKLRSEWIRFFGNQSFDLLQNGILNRLPDKNFETDAQGNRVCTNCEANPTAGEVLGREAAFGHSLFSISCRQYL